MEEKCQKLFISTFPKGTHFKFTWRTYQKRVLEELNEHLNDQHLHIIAPPGSGKTVLGLEVARRLNKPTLILTPTKVIRNQWIQRFCELFIQTSTIPSWISNSIKDPDFLTVSTYQGLHSALTLQEEDLLIEKLKKLSVGTLILDEAHHLKNSWWESLNRIKKELNVTIVGLTATPPFDVSSKEWNRYIELNGPIDTEISIPELIQERNLCPHQDFIFFSTPTENEYQKINDYRSRIDHLYNEIISDQKLIQAFEQHPIFQNPLDHLDWIYSNIEYYTATLIFLHTVGKDINPVHFEVIGDANMKIPYLTYAILESLLTFYLFKENHYFSNYINHQEKLTNKLKRFGAIEHRNIQLIYNSKTNRYLSSSVSKLNSIQKIVAFEYTQLHHNLRMVILSDFIRKEYLTNDSKLEKLGVIPIFEHLRRSLTPTPKLGVLTGALIIIPKSILSNLNQFLTPYNSSFSCSSLPYDNQYIIIKAEEPSKRYIITGITSLFQQGFIEVLVGTKSLLGEGWDAPSINSLILASYVGSYVSSNQMRGRAIRINPFDKTKVSNIWHLACIDLTADDNGHDFQLLKRRFKSFVGIFYNEENGIENGINRLNIIERLDSHASISNYNKKIFLEAQKRKNLFQLWNNALKKGTTLIEEIKIPFYNKKRKNYQSIKAFYFNKTIHYTLGGLISSLIYFGFDSLKAFLQSLHQIKTPQDFYNWLLYVAFIGIIINSGIAYRTLKMYIQYRDIANDFKHIGQALLQTLIQTQDIKAESSELNIISSIDKNGAVYCRLKGGSSYEKLLFINALEEIVNPINNPRYIIIRKSSLFKTVSQKDYHAVPEIIGKNKQNALIFTNNWSRLVGKCDLIFTRTLEGRKLLLKSRIQSLSSQFQDSLEHVNRWK